MCSVLCRLQAVGGRVQPNHASIIQHQRVTDVSFNLSLLSGWKCSWTGLVNKLMDWFLWVKKGAHRDQSYSHQADCGGTEGVCGAAVPSAMYHQPGTAGQSKTPTSVSDTHLLALQPKYIWMWVYVSLIQPYHLEKSLTPALVCLSRPCSTAAGSYVVCEGSDFDKKLSLV